MITFGEAEDFCISQSQESKENEFLFKSALSESQIEARLLTVTTAEEQNFIVNHLLSNNNIANVWLGARFEATSKSFCWRDTYNKQVVIGEKLINVISKDGYSKEVYTNWLDGHPKTNATDQCVKMTASKNNQGQWIEVACSENNEVVCERNQVWSVYKFQFQQFQQALLKLRKAEEETKAAVHSVFSKHCKK